MAIALALILSIVAVTFLTTAYNYYSAAEQHYLDTKGYYALEAGKAYASAQAWGKTNLDGLGSWNISVDDSNSSAGFIQPDPNKEEYILAVTAQVP